MIISINLLLNLRQSILIRPRTNNQIKALILRVLNEQGGQLGIMNKEEALRLAQSQGLDLIEIAPQAQPPVAKITDLGKYLYQLAKKEKEIRAKSKPKEIKTIRFGFRIAKHDLEIKAKQAREFLQKEHQVKIELRLRGREKTLMGLALEKFNDFLKTIGEENFEMEYPPKKHPLGWITQLNPKKK